jgi:hypothetical protein
MNAATKIGASRRGLASTALGVAVSGAGAGMVAAGAGEVAVGVDVEGLVKHGQRQRSARRVAAPRLLGGQLRHGQAITWPYSGRTPRRHVTNGSRRLTNGSRRHPAERPTLDLKGPAIQGRMEVLS